MSEPVVVVAGASGVLGVQVCRALRVSVPGVRVVAGDHRSERLETTRSRSSADEVVQLDIDSLAMLDRAMDSADAVVACVSGRTTALQEAALSTGTHLVSVDPWEKAARWVRGLDQDARQAGCVLLSMGGLFPGLSGLLVRSLAAGLTSVNSAELLLTQSANADVGRAGTIDMLRMVATPVETPSGAIRGFDRKHERVPSHRRVQYPEAALVSEALHGAAVRYYTAWDSAVLNAAIAGAARLRVLDPLAPTLARLKRHSAAQPEKAQLTVEVAGATDDHDVTRTAVVEVDSDYAGTATSAAALTRLALGGHMQGAGVPMDLVTLDQVMPYLDPDVLTLTQNPPGTR